MPSETGRAAARREAAERRGGGLGPASGPSAVARHPGHAAQPAVNTIATTTPTTRAGTFASIPGCGSATRARPTGNSGDNATASIPPMSPPAAPIAAARTRQAAISCARVIPSARMVPNPAASMRLCRASNWPRMNSPMMPNSAASSHSATACGRIERSVLTDWSDSSAACTSLPSACLASSR
jgi:hypothetical protein